jgi:hypothetical protein
MIFTSQIIIEWYVNKYIFTHGTKKHVDLQEIMFMSIW